MAEQKMDWKDIKKFIRRRWKAFALIFSIVLFSSIIIAFLLPPIYRAQSTILIEEQQIPENFVQSTITTYAEERLKTIKEQVLSVERLKAIINEFNLYPEIQQEYGISEAVGTMRESIETETESANFTNRATGRSIASTIAFILYYEGRDPQTVQKVTNVLAELFLQEDIKIKEKATKATTSFLMNEIESLKKQIQTYDEKISDFKQAHFGELPEHNTVNLDSIARLERELDNIDMQIRSIEERKLNLQGQLATIDPLLPINVDGQSVARNPSEQLKYLRLKLISLQSSLSDKHPDVIKIKNEIRKLEGQTGSSGDYQAELKTLNKLKVDLSTMQGRYGPKHPDVIKLKKEIRILEKSIKKKKSRRSQVRTVGTEVPDNPMYINLRTQIFSLQNTINNLEMDKKNIREDLAEYREKVHRAPFVEIEYNELTRDYDVTKKKYNELMNKLMAANLAQGMEEVQIGQRFEIKSYAYLPGKPHKPNRMAIILLGFVLGVGAGLGLVSLQEFFDDSIKSEKELSALFDMPVLTIISKVETRQEKMRHLGRRFMWAFAAFGLILVGGKLLNDYVIPINDLFEMIVNNAKSM
jgi:uncharacterized protein involved in exopolysaccharide biosynthesis